MLQTTPQIPTETVQLPLVERGNPDGVPVVFLHGLSDSHRSYGPILDHLPHEIRAIAMTQRGHGDAPKPDAGYSPHHLAVDVIHAMNDAGIVRGVVAGHSMGSAVAAHVAAMAPERVAGVVLMGARVSWDAPEMHELWEVMAALEDPVDPAFVREFQESTLAHPVPPDFLEMVVAESLKLPARVWHALAEGLVDDYRDVVSEIAAPTLLAWGDQDDIAVRSEQDALLQTIHGAELKVYRGGGHAFHWEDPAAYAADIAAFVSERVIPLNRS